jgi:DNA (cytosine-5)-methyltransferase 1
MSFPDNIDRAARTIITGEGGSAASRFKHVVQHPDSTRLRRLTPVELEKISMFKPNHTKIGLYAGKEIEMSPNARAFFIGNALVTGVVTELGKNLLDLVDSSK